MMSHSLRPGLTAVCAGLALGVSMYAQAQSVALGGMMGNKALLMVDGKPPKSVAPGETYLGVKVLSIATEEAVVEVGRIAGECGRKRWQEDHANGR
jgi:aspartyl protease family protein